MSHLLNSNAATLGVQFKVLTSTIGTITEKIYLMKEDWHNVILH